MMSLHIHFYTADINFFHTFSHPLITACDQSSLVFRGECASFSFFFSHQNAPVTSSFNWNECEVAHTVNEAASSLWIESIIVSARQKTERRPIIHTLFSLGTEGERATRARDAFFVSSLFVFASKSRQKADKCIVCLMNLSHLTVHQSKTPVHSVQWNVLLTVARVRRVAFHRISVLRECRRQKRTKLTAYTTTRREERWTGEQVTLMYFFSGPWDLVISKRLILSRALKVEESKKRQPLVKKRVKRERGKVERERKSGRE